MNVLQLKYITSRNERETRRLWGGLRTKYGRFALALPPDTGPKQIGSARRWWFQDTDARAVFLA